MCTEMCQDDFKSFLNTGLQSGSTSGVILKLKSLEYLDKFKKLSLDDFEVYNISGARIQGISLSKAREVISKTRLKSDLHRLYFVTQKGFMEFQRNPSLWKEVSKGVPSLGDASQYPCLLIVYNDQGFVKSVTGGSILDSDTDAISEYLDVLYCKAKKQNRIVGEWFVFD